MAMADSLPGVSGGTIAFILGYYDQFIDSFNTLLNGKKGSGRKKALSFLIKLGIGWIAGMILSILFISALFESRIYSISSLFIGLVLFAIPIIYQEEKKVIAGNHSHLIFTLLGILVVVLLTLFNPSSGGSGINLALGSLDIGLVVFVFVAGMVAISAMVLPGISGSTILLILGLYTGLIEAAKGLITLDFSYLPIVIVFALGILLGFKTTVRLIRYLLKNHRSAAIYTVLGLMIGSLYAIVMGPTTLENPVDPLSFKTFDFLFFFIGVGVMFLLDRIKIYFNKKQEIE